jgi:hypothetical protein
LPPECTTGCTVTFVDGEAAESFGGHRFAGVPSGFRLAVSNTAKPRLGYVWLSVVSTLSVSATSRRPERAANRRSPALVVAEVETA